jgi:hypothetical protein
MPAEQRERQPLRNADAVLLHQRALGMRPEDATAHNNLGVA